MDGNPRPQGARPCEKRDASPMAEALRCAHRKATVAEVYSNREDTRKFASGYVVNVDADSVLLAHIAPSGNHDGFHIHRLDCVYQVAFDTKYTRMLEKLYRAQRVEHDEVGEAEDGNLVSLLRYAKRTGKYVSIELLAGGAWDLEGCVAELGAQAVTVRKIDEYGEDDGQGVAYLSDITAMDCDCEENVERQMLHADRPV